MKLSFLISFLKILSSRRQTNSPECTLPTFAHRQGRVDWGAVLDQQEVSKPSFCTWFSQNCFLKWGGFILHKATKKRSRWPVPQGVSPESHQKIRLMFIRDTWRKPNNGALKIINQEISKCWPEEGIVLETLAHLVLGFFIGWQYKKDGKCHTRNSLWGLWEK